MVRMSSDISVLGSSTQVSGRVSGEGGLRVEGRLSGDVAITGPLEIATGASVEGDVSAGSLEVAGKLHGDASCKGTINVRAGADVRGDLSGSAVSIEPGSRVDVRLSTDFTLDFEESR
jgi:cytoskeletal protein CcmA (bactofilin family)